jgi:hypothetical protein
VSPQYFIERLYQILLPTGGLLFMMEAYFDESGTHHDSSVMAVAGYLFTPEAAAGLTRDLDQALKRYGLPYFRMSECANGAGPYKSLSMTDRIAIETKLIRSINLRAEVGFAVSVSIADYERLTDELFRDALGDAYSFCCQWCLDQVGTWADKHSVDTPVAYFFEAGHTTAARTSAYFNEIPLNPEAKKQYRYASHTFADKKTVLPLQAADLLAWHWYSAAKRKLSNRNARVRKDTDALLAAPSHYLDHYNEAKLIDVFTRTAKENTAIKVLHEKEQD